MKGETIGDGFQKGKVEDSKVSSKGHTRLETSDLEEYQFVLDRQDLFEIRVLYEVSREFDLELPKSNAWVKNPPLGSLEVYEEASEDGLRSPFFSSRAS